MYYVSTRVVDEQMINVIIIIVTTLYEAKRLTARLI